MPVRFLFKGGGDTVAKLEIKPIGVRTQKLPSFEPVVPITPRKERSPSRSPSPPPPPDPRILKLDTNKELYKEGKCSSKAVIHVLYLYFTILL